jgi:hypothetical protein
VTIQNTSQQQYVNCGPPVAVARHSNTFLVADKDAMAMIAFQVAVTVLLVWYRHGHKSVCVQPLHIWQTAVLQHHSSCKGRTLTCRPLFRYRLGSRTVFAVQTCAQAHEFLVCTAQTIVLQHHYLADVNSCNTGGVAAGAHLMPSQHWWCVVRSNVEASLSYKMVFVLYLLVYRGCNGIAPVV